MTRSKTNCRGTRRRSRPGVEGLESRRLLAATLDFTALPLPPAAGGPTSIAVAPDGNVWFTVPGAVENSVANPPAQVGVFNPTTRTTTLIRTPTSTADLESIVSGPADALWFADYDIIHNKSYVGAVNETNHGIVEFPVPNVGRINSVAVGPDGEIWFTDAAKAAVGVFNIFTLKATEFPLPNANEVPASMISGPGGKLWFTVRGGTVGGISQSGIDSIEPTTHAITETGLGVGPGPFGVPILPGATTVGPDGSPWFVEVNPNTSIHIPAPVSYLLAEISPSGHVIATFSGGGAGGITAGPDHNLWYSDIGLLGVTVPATRAASTQALPNPATPFASVITTAADGHLWLAGPGYIAEATIIPPPQAAVSGSVSIDPLGQGTTAFGFAANQAVYLDLNKDGEFDPGDPVAVTDAFGNYAFSGLAPGTYTVRVVPYAGIITTNPSSGGETVTVGGGTNGKAGPLGVGPYSSVLPVNVSANPFGVHNPDVQTAEVNGLYNLLFNRAPDPVGQANSVAFLKNGGSLATLTRILERTTEYETDVVASYYTNFLHRAGSPSEIAAWVGLLKDGYTEEQVAQLFVTSAGFNSLYATDAAYVEALFEDFLGRQASASEVAAWESYLHLANRTAVAHLFVYGGPTMTNAVVGLSSAIEGQIVDAATSAAEVPLLSAGMLTLADVVTSYASSAAFIQRANATVG